VIQVFLFIVSSSSQQQQQRFTMWFPARVHTHVRKLQNLACPLHSNTCLELVNPIIHAARCRKDDQWAQRCWASKGFTTPCFAAGIKVLLHTAGDATEISSMNSRFKERLKHFIYRIAWRTVNEGIFDGKPDGAHTHGIS